MSPTLHQHELTAGAVAACLERASRDLLERRGADGLWCAWVDAGVGPVVDYLLLSAWLADRGSGLRHAPELAESIIGRQESDGGFAMVPGGAVDLDLSARAYAALRLNGVERQCAGMTGCLAAIHRAGGLEKAGALARLDLNFAGLCPREACLSFPVEIMFFARRRLEPLSAWAVATAVPLLIVQTLNRPPASDSKFSGRELSATGNWPADGGAGWLRWWGNKAPAPIRQAALGRAEKWLVGALDRDGGPHETFPAIRYTLMALDLLGYDNESPPRRRLMDCLDSLSSGAAVQPYRAPVRDTAIAARSIDEAGAAPGVSFQRTADWLISRQQELPGDDLGRGTFRVEDTAAALLALSRVQGSEGRLCERAVQLSIRGLLAAQAAGGGWASYERRRTGFRAPKLGGIDQRTLTDLPSPGITGLVLEAICQHGLNGQDAAVRKAVDYLISSQNLDGSWLGRWTGSYVGATCFAVSGLAAAGEDANEAHMLRAGEWLRSVQNADGGWGEDRVSFHNEEFVSGGSAVVPTARALLGLIASGDSASDSVVRGVTYLVERQGDPGEDDLPAPTGTWQGGALYVMTDLDSICYPMLALARYRKVRNEARGDNT